MGEEITRLLPDEPVDGHLAVVIVQRRVRAVLLLTP
jgi:hypothetical protein